jgi:single-strand DNA-binding protein
MNKIIIMGRLGKDPEQKTTQSGKTVASMSVATSETWKDNEGNKQEKTQWHRVICWEGTAHAASYLSKGQQVLIEGKMTYRQYEADGMTKNIAEILAERIHFISDGSRSRDAGQHQQQQMPQTQRSPQKQQGWQQPQQPQQPQPKTGYQQGPQGAYPDDDDIPF